MVYDAELEKGQPPTVRVHPPVPEQSLYLYPRTPGKSHNLHTGEISKNMQSVIVGPMGERVNLSIGYNHFVQVFSYAGGLSLMKKSSIMLASKKRLDLSPIGMVFQVVKTAQETRGLSLEMEWELLPKTAGTPLHIHPTSRETYRVLEGQLEINVNGNWRLLQRGESLTVIEGVPHTFRNPSDKSARVYHIHAPALQFEQYFEGLAAVVDKLSAGKKERLKMTFSAVNRLAMLMKKHKAEIVPVNPPAFIINLLHFIGKVRRLKV